MLERSIEVAVKDSISPCALRQNTVYDALKRLGHAAEQEMLLLCPTLGREIREDRRARDIDVAHAAHIEGDQLGVTVQFPYLAVQIVGVAEEQHAIEHDDRPLPSGVAQDVHVVRRTNALRVHLVSEHDTLDHRPAHVDDEDRARQRHACDDARHDRIEHRDAHDDHDDGKIVERAPSRGP